MFKPKNKAPLFVLIFHLSELELVVSNMSQISNTLVILLWTICLMMVIFVGQSDVQVCSHDVIC